MAAKKFSPVEQHVEKVILGGCALILVFVCYSYLIQNPAVVALDTRTLGPSALEQELDGRANSGPNSLRARLEEKKLDPEQRPRPVDLSTPLERFRKGLLIEKGDQLAQALRLPPIDPSNKDGLLAAFQPPAVALKADVTDVAIQQGDTTPRMKLAAALAPAKLTHTTGRSFKDPQATGLGGFFEGFGEPADPAAAPAGPTDFYWVTISGELDRRAQVAAQAAARVLQPEVYFYLAVELERMEVTPQGRPLADRWQRIAPLPNVALERIPSFPPGDLNPQDPAVQAIINPELENSFIRRVSTPEYQRSVLQPPPLAVVGDGDPWGPPLATDGGFDPAAVVPGTINSDAPLVWAHDSTPEAGKSYRYRMRLMLYNRFAGQPERFEHPADAAVIAIESQWVESDIVTIQSDVQWFVNGAAELGNRATATVAVFKTEPGGKARRATANVQSGAPIGARIPRTDIEYVTNIIALAILGPRDWPREAIIARTPLAIEPSSRPQPADATVVYYDPIANKVHFRRLADDEANQDRVSLEEMAKATAADTPR